MARILVVDEDSRSRKQAAVKLRHLGCTVRTVGDSNAALAIVRNVRLDTILVSASLPQISATTFVDALRLEDGPAKVPVIVMAVTPRAAIDAIRAGARGYVRKPLDVGGILSAMPALLRGLPDRQRHAPAARGRRLRRRAPGLPPTRPSVTP